MAGTPIHVIGHWLQPDGTADAGTVTIYARPPIRFLSGETEGSSKVQFTLDGTGKLNGDTGVVLIANDSPGVVDPNTVWIAEFDLANQSPDAPRIAWFQLFVADTDPVPLPARLQVTAAPAPAALYATLAQLLAHATTIASATVLGHIKSDEVTLHVDPTSGVASVLGGGGSGHIIQDEGTSLPGETRLNFAGAGVTATDDPGHSATLITIPGGGGLGSATPLADSGAGSVGAAGSASHEDHRHPLSPAYAQTANNLSDLASAGTARTNLGLGTAATRNVPASGNAASSEVVKGDDTRLTDSRPPAAHASTHATAGSDPVSPASIGAATSAALTAHTGNLSNPHSVTAGQTGAFAVANNLSEGTPATLRGNLGLGLVATLLGAVARVQQYLGGVLQGTRRGINLVAGTNVTITAADNAGTESVDYTINASGGGGGVSVPLDLPLADSGTTTAPTVLTLDHTTSGTPAAGFGLAFDQQMHDATNVLQRAGRLLTQVRDAAHATFSSTTGLWIAQAGTFVERLRLGGGTIPDPGGNNTITEVGQFPDQGSQFRVTHNFWDGQGVDRWALVVTPPPSFTLADLSLRFGYTYNQPAMELAGMALQFVDSDTTIRQPGSGLLWNQPDNHFIQWGSPDGNAWMIFGHTYGFLVGDAYGGNPLLQVRHGQATTSGTDIKFLNATDGVLLKDRTTGTYYRLFVNNGVLDIE